MGFLRRLFERLGPVYTEDPVFGRIRRFGVGLWEARVAFRPIPGETEVTVEAGDEGPTDAQRGLYKEIERRYDEVFETILDILPEHLSAWNVHAARETLRDDLRFDAIVVYQPNPGGAEWSITYYVKSIGHHATVTFTRWSPTDIVIDG